MYEKIRLNSKNGMTVHLIFTSKDDVKLEGYRYINFSKMNR